MSKENRWKYRRASIASWDIDILNRIHNCPSHWLSGPEGGCSQMFMCEGCGKEFIVHPGHAEEIEKP